MTKASNYHDWESWEKIHQNKMSDLWNEDMFDMLLTQNNACKPPINEEYVPSAEEIKEIVLSLIVSRNITMIDLREHPEDIITSVSEFLKILRKKST